VSRPITQCYLPRKALDSHFMPTESEGASSDTLAAEAADAVVVLDFENCMSKFGSN